MKWVKSSKYDETRLKLENFLDIDLRAGLNFVLDVFGQKICKKENPKCGKCLLRDNCGYYKKTINKITKNNKDATSILITKDVSDKYDINDYQNKKREENFDDFEFF